MEKFSKYFSFKINSLYVSALTEAVSYCKSGHKYCIQVECFM